MSITTTTNVDHKSRPVMLLHEHCFEENKVKSKPTFCQLCHPKTGQPAYFLFANNRVYELIRFKEEFRSWFIGESVQQDDSLYITTPVDPVLLMLPYLLQASKKNSYEPIGQLIADENFPECRRLCDCEGVAHLSSVATKKEIGEMTVYKFDEDLTLQWLSLKVARVVKELKAKKINVSNVAQVAMFVDTEHEASDEQYDRYAHGLVSDYLPGSLGLQLQKHLRIKDIVHERPSIEQPCPKRAKNGTTDEVMPTEDYTNGKAPVGKTRTTKLTVAQKRLEKVDKSNMKNISSFFTVKTAKK